MEITAKVPTWVCQRAKPQIKQTMLNLFISLCSSALFKLNVISLVVGLGVSFGLFLVGNFQIPRNKTIPHKKETPTEGDKVIQFIHWIGAFLAFFGGLAWMCMHTAISIVLCKDPNKGIWRKKLAVIRFAITLGIFCVLMAGIAIGVLFRQSYEIKWPPQPT